MLKVSKAWLQGSVLTVLGGSLLSAAAIFTLGEDEGLRVQVTRVPAPAPASVSALAATTPAPIPVQASAPRASAKPRRKSKKDQASDEDRFEQLMARFDAFESRLAALEGRGAGGMPVGQLIAAPAGQEVALATQPLTSLEQRFAAIEARLQTLDQAKRVSGLEGRIKQLQRRFKKAEEKVQISQLSANEQVGLALNTPLGRELLVKIEGLQGKLDALLSKRVIPASTYGSLIPGLWGTYYADRYFTERAGVQIDPLLDFDWGNEAPEILAGKKDDFSVRWEGVIRISQPGTYSFYTVSDDGVRLWIGDQLVVAEYDDHAQQEDLVDLELEVGDYPLRLEYYERGGRALVRLLWKLGGNDRGAIPAEALFHTVDQERM